MNYAASESAVPTVCPGSQHRGMPRLRAMRQIGFGLVAAFGKGSPTVRSILLMSIVVALGGVSGPVWGENAINKDDRALQAFRIGNVLADVRAAPPGAERDYFAGMADNARGRLDDSNRYLTSALPELRRSRPERAAKALLALADNDIKAFRYADAAATLDDLLANFSRNLAPDQVANAKNDQQLYHILSGATAQTVTVNGPVSLKTSRNPLGSLDADLTVNGIKGAWLLDTGANMSVVSESYAKELRLVALPGVAGTQASLTGIENRIRIALIPDLQMGGVVLHHVVALILPDAGLNVQYNKEGSRYQINAIIGYPVFQALRRVTFTHNGEFLAGDGAMSSYGGANLYMRALVPVIECSIEGQKFPFSFDTGASKTQLLITYYQHFQARGEQWRLTESTSAGAGGAVHRKAYLQDRLKLKVGGRIATLLHVRIDVTAAGADEEDLYGNLGQDLVAGFDSFTIDFETMRMRLGTPLPKRAEP